MKLAILKKSKRRASLLLFAAIYSIKLFPQAGSNLNIVFQSDISSSCSFMVMTMLHDQNNQPYLYVANKEAGLKIYNVSSLTTPTLIATVPITLFDTLHVMNLTQDGNYLYLTIGNFLGFNHQKSGMAIVDISIPSAPVVTDYYVVPGSTNGAGIVKVEGNYAYLGAMQSGLVILDIQNKSNILPVSQFIPSITFPPITNPTPSYYNARGMQVKNSIVYLCYDGGGIRIINCTDKLHPAETGHWCNPTMYSPFDHPKAYNNITLNGNIAYVAVDYAGMEVLDITDTSNITMLGWWNPYNAPVGAWNNCNIHTNELYYDKNCDLVFISSGKSDLHVINVANPTTPDSCNYYGGVGNGISTWGLNIWKNQIYLSYICSAIPFASSQTKVSILTYDTCSVTGINKVDAKSQTKIYPNPFTSEAYLFTEKMLNNATLTITNSFGEQLKQIKNIKGNKYNIERGDLPCGVYFISLSQNSEIILTQKLVIAD